MTNKLTPSRYKEILADVIRLFNTARHSLATAYDQDIEKLTMQTAPKAHEPVYPAH